MEKDRLKLYWRFKELRRRCSPAAKPGDYERYFLRGIRVCERWQGRDGFSNFVQDMGYPPTPAHEIHRIDNNGDYEPGNCEWVTQEVQDAHRRLPTHAIPDDVREQVIEAINNGASYGSQARRFGLEKSTPRQIYKRYLRSLEGAGQ